MRVVVILMLILEISCHSIKSKKNSTRDCENFRVGKFKYSDGVANGVSILRTNDQQIETINGEIHYIFKMEWSGDCQYILIPQTRLYNSIETKICNDTVFVSITNVLSDSLYEFNAISKGLVTKGRVIKIR